MLRIEITDVKQAADYQTRLKTGNFRLNKELNQEWLDVLNSGTEPVDLAGRVIAAVNTKTSSSILNDIIPQKAVIRSSSVVPLYPGEVLRIFTGEQPFESTYIPDEHNISRVIWLLNPTYLWTDKTNEARIYLDLYTMRNLGTPLAKYTYNPWF